MVIELPPPGTHEVMFNETGMSWPDVVASAREMVIISVSPEKAVSHVESPGVRVSVRKLAERLKGAKSFKDMVKIVRDWASLNGADLVMWISEIEIPRVYFYVVLKSGVWRVGKWMIKVMEPSTGGIGVLLVKPDGKRIYLAPIVNERMKVRLPKYLVEKVKGLIEFEEVEV